MTIGSYPQIPIRAMSVDDLTLEQIDEIARSANTNFTPDAVRLVIIRLVSEALQLRSSVERIGHERDQMIAADVELQTRLSACISALEFGEFVVLNSQRYLPGATGIERDAGKFLDRCEALLHAQDNK